MKRNILLFGCITCCFILVSLSYQPIIANNTNIPNLDHNKVVIEFCGVNNNDKYELLLSDEKLEKLDIIFNDLNNSLKGENDAIIISSIIQNKLEELCNIGIINESSLIKCNNLFSKYASIIRNYEKLPVMEDDKIEYNIMSFIVGEFGPAVFASLPSLAIIAILILIGTTFDLFSSDISPAPSFFDMILFAFTVATIGFSTFINPISIFQIVDFTSLLLAFGWINTLGLLGYKSLQSGEGRALMGQIYGYTGLKILRNGVGFQCIGFAPYLWMAYRDF